MSPGQTLRSLIRIKAEHGSCRRLDGIKPLPGDLFLMGKYFLLPGTIFGVQKYRLTVVDLQELLILLCDCRDAS